MSDKEKKEVKEIADKLMDKKGVKPCECGSTCFEQEITATEEYALLDNGTIYYGETSNHSRTNDPLRCQECGKKAECYDEKANPYDFERY